MAAATRQFFHLTHRRAVPQHLRPSRRLGPGTALVFSGHHPSPKLRRISSLNFKDSSIILRASSSADEVDDDEEGISLGTMKLPPNIDIARFEALLFQWANSLCQGANLPLPVPFKVDRVQGGARLGFIEIDGGKTDVTVFIDCLVFPPTESSGPFFRAIRNGPQKDKAPPGEPRIMRSLLQALQKSVDIATL